MEAEISRGGMREQAGAKVVSFSDSVKEVSSWGGGGGLRERERERVQWLLISLGAEYKLG